jgi:hypothetical protein
MRKHPAAIGLDAGEERKGRGGLEHRHAAAVHAARTKAPRAPQQLARHQRTKQFLGEILSGRAT